MYDENTPNDADPQYTEGDYGYDMAHDAMDGRPDVDDEAAEQTAVPTLPAVDDTGGDYGYDLAHDMRG